MSDAATTPVIDPTAAPPAVRSDRVAAIVYPLANLVVDIAYFWLDPRTQRG